MQTLSIFPATLNPDYRTLIFLIASADTNHEVSALGDIGLKRYVTINHESPTLVEMLYELYNCKARDSMTISMPNNAPPPEFIRALNILTFTGTPLHRLEPRNPSSQTLKLKILGLFMKSKKATDDVMSFDVALECIEDKTHARLRTSGMGFIQWIARMVKKYQKYY